MGKYQRSSTNHPPWSYFFPLYLPLNQASMVEMWRGTHGLMAGVIFRGVGFIFSGWVSFLVVWVSWINGWVSFLVVWVAGFHHSLVRWLWFLWVGGGWGGSAIGMGFDRAYGYGRGFFFFFFLVVVALWLMWWWWLWGLPSWWWFLVAVGDVHGYILFYCVEMRENK